MTTAASMRSDPALWAVVLGLVVYWVFLAVRAIRWRAVPWYLKTVSLVAYPLAIVALLVPRYQYQIGGSALVLMVIGFATDALWLRTDVFGRFDDPARKPRPGRHRPGTG